MRRLGERALRKRTRTAAFAFGVLLGLPVALLLASIIEPPLPVALFLIYIPGSVLLGLLAERLVPRDLATTPEQLAVARLEERHEQRLMELESQALLQQSSGVSAEERTQRLEAARSAELAEFHLEAEKLETSLGRATTRERQRAP